MAGPTRNRGCCYYIPWLVTFLLCLLAAGIGMMVHYGNLVYNHVIDGLDVLGVSSAKNQERFKPAVIATAVVSLVLVVLVAGLSLARSFIEAAHDATGQSGGGSGVWMAFNVIVAIPWWCEVVWLVLLLMAATLTTALLYVVRVGLDEILKINEAVPITSWLPDNNTLCPPQCLNLSYFDFLNFTYENSCVCSADKLRSARTEFARAVELSPVMLVGIFVLFLASMGLLVNFACQFSHTKRERDYLRRLSNKQFVQM